MRRKPSGFIGICACGSIVAAMDIQRTDRSEAGKELGQWLMDGLTVEPRFGGTWSESVGGCTCSTEVKSEKPGA